MAKAKKSKRFNYNLAAVLKVRELKEQQEKDRFSEAQQKLQEEERKEEEIKDFQRQKYNELRNIMDAGKTINNFQHILMRKSHLDIVKEQVAEQVKKREQAEDAKEEQREVLSKAMKDRKVIEKDKEKKKTAWKKLMDKEEGKFLDEISTIGYERRRREDNPDFK